MWIYLNLRECERSIFDRDLSLTEIFNLGEEFRKKFQKCSAIVKISHSFLLYIWIIIYGSLDGLIIDRVGKRETVESTKGEEKE